MADVYFTQNKEDRKKITKNIDINVSPVSCVLKENTSIFSPTIIVSKEAAGALWASYNYAYIPDFGNRYYFIDAVTAETGGKLAYHMTVDPLKTYAADLLSTSFFIARSQSVNSKYFLDTEKALEVKKTIKFSPPLGHIPQDATGNRFCITVSGGM